jgi:hypothetical protein
MKRITVAVSLTASLALGLVVPSAGAQTLSPTSANFPPTPLRTDSAPIRFTLTAGATTMDSATGVGENTYALGTFKETNTCPSVLAPLESCFIDVVFAPYLPTPVHKTNVLYAGGMTAPLSGDVKTAGGKKKCKKGKKGSAAAAKKKCKKGKKK